MGSLYIKGGKLWARYKDGQGKWSGAPTPYGPDAKDKARRFMRELEARARAMAEAGGAAGLAPGEPMTVARYAVKWLADRQALGLATAGDDASRLRLHALPIIGHMKIDDVRPRHIRDLVLALRKDAKLAPRSIRHVNATLATMFKTAVADELILASPCVLARGILPKNVDADPTFRANAIFTREEVERLISDPRILEDRRVLYAIKGLAGVRHGEAARLRWRNYDPTLDPLGALDLELTKTQVPRRIPVHATLARVLAEWKLAGWERTYGRAPSADDFIVPTRNMTERPSPDAQYALLLDLAMLGVRPCRGHDLRRTFITLAQVDGGRRDLLETITHGPRGNIMNVYTTFPWPALCDEVRKLKIELREGQVLDGDFRVFATGLATAQRNWRNRWRKPATPAGFEPAFMP